MASDTYTLLDFGNGRRLEQWGPVVVDRPDPTAVGLPASPAEWSQAQAVYEGEKGRGRWNRRTALPDEWNVLCGDLEFIVHLTPYKHTGLFPEQAENWRWMRAQAAQSGRTLRVLNLFAYTGGSTIALAKDGHFVTHVDASRPAITLAKRNANLNDIPDDRIRWMLEDAVTFVRRECQRGKTYDAIILDPPVVGHSPSGAVWRIERDLAPLLESCVKLLSSQPVFLLLNGYAHGDTTADFQRLLTGILMKRSAHKRFRIEAHSLDVVSSAGRRLSTGIVARCSLLGC